MQPQIKIGYYYANQVKTSSQKRDPTMLVTPIELIPRSRMVRLKIKGFFQKREGEWKIGSEFLLSVDSFLTVFHPATKRQILKALPIEKSKEYARAKQ